MGRAGGLAGRRVYFVADADAPGTMAEQALLDPRRAVTLPDEADPVVIAAGMNPAMSSWVALRRRIAFRSGQSVLILGATGNAGRMAVQIARHLGAAGIVAAGRDPHRLELLTDLGATQVVSLAGDPVRASERLGRAAGDVDVVLDYTWGAPPSGRSPPCSPTAPNAPSLSTGSRSARRRGRTSRCRPPYCARPTCGSWAAGRDLPPAAGIVAELPSLIEQFCAGTLTAGALPVPLAEVERAWTAPADSGRRVVLTASA